MPNGRLRTAYHEAGHFLVARHLGFPVMSATTRRRGGQLGHVGVLVHFTEAAPSPSLQEVVDAYYTGTLVPAPPPPPTTASDRDLVLIAGLVAEHLLRPFAPFPFGEEAEGWDTTDQLHDAITRARAILLAYPAELEGVALLLHSAPRRFTTAEIEAVVPLHSVPRASLEVRAEEIRGLLQTGTPRVRRFAWEWLHEHGFAEGS